MEYVSISSNLSDRFKCVRIKAVIRSSLIRVCLDEWLHVGDPYEP